MRLLELRACGNIAFTRDFIGRDQPPPFAILSHTWGPDHEEVTYNDVIGEKYQDKAGYRKIKFCAKRARRDGLKYFWVDSCCINKSDSSELQRAINSMFKWYKNAAVCYAYLADIIYSANDGVESSSDEGWEGQFRKSRWFKRGWTLQELIAPGVVKFYCAAGRLLGDRESLEKQIHEITGITRLALRHVPLSQFSVEERMSWLQGRETRIEEDMAYCMLGIFEVFMPLIPGEGEESALRRLREEIEKCSRHDTRLSRLRAEPSPEDKRDFAIEMRRQLKFVGMEDRSESIHEAAKATFSWIFNPGEQKHGSSFVDWLREDGDRIYWITGKMGSGKSTLIRYIRQHQLLQTYLRQWGNGVMPTVLCFYFWNSGLALQRSNEGLLRTLLDQALAAHSEVAECAFPDRFEIAMRRNEEELAFAEKFTVPELTMALHRAVRMLSESKRLFILVDGLDEFEGRSQEIISLVKSLDQSNVKQCVSSRPWNAFRDVFLRGPSLRLEDLTAADIEVYVTQRLSQNSAFRQFESVYPGNARHLQYTLVLKASGVFLWAVSVVQLLLDDLCNGKNGRDLQHRIDSTPESLSHLFWKVLMDQEPGNLSNASQIFQLVEATLAPRKLTRSDDDFGIIRDDSVKRSLVRFENALIFSYAWEEDDESAFKLPVALLTLEECNARVELFNRRINDCTKGLLEVCPAKENIQYIHRSVRDFINSRDTWKSLLSLGPKKFDPEKRLANAYLALMKNTPTFSFEDKISVTLSFAGCFEAKTSAYQERFIDELDETLCNDRQLTFESKSGFLRGRFAFWKVLIDMELSTLIELRVSKIRKLGLDTKEDLIRLAVPRRFRFGSWSSKPNLRIFFFFLKHFGGDIDVKSCWEIFASYFFYRCGPLAEEPNILRYDRAPPVFMIELFIKKGVGRDRIEHWLGLDTPIRPYYRDEDEGKRCPLRQRLQIFLLRRLDEYWSFGREAVLRNVLDEQFQESYWAINWESEDLKKDEQEIVLEHIMKCREWELYILNQLARINKAGKNSTVKTPQEQRPSESYC